MKNKKVAVVFPTGRKTTKKVVDMLADSLVENGHTGYNFQLIISYDPTFYGLPPEAFKVGSKAKEVFGEITYSGPDDFEIIANEINGTIQDKAAVEVLFKPRGYCTQKNRALFHALKGRADHILFLDDDEYYTAPFKEFDSSLKWISQDVFGAHLETQKKADITNGGHTGYFSPVPSEIDLKLEESLRERLGRILAIGSEVITSQTFVHTRDAVRYGSKDFAEGQPYEVEAVNGVKFLTGGNIALNTESIRKGKIPPYFNPIGARGEDAILGMQLEHAKVMKVPTYTFHDPFQKYVDITEGKFPESIDAIQVIPGTIDRFCRACVGWVKYAPFLIRMTTDSESEYGARIDTMRSELTDIGLEIDQQLQWDGFKELGPTLEKYHSRSQQDLEDLSRAREAWQGLVKRL
ncbi:hypothetical protein HOI26_05415 [Candidatus Woesearchaeota archaeon]|jgi:hypothetical protein|nr:hypothetical protein [Candidatus Woesearchaeota archaeon]MBT5740506.1 hypothetical protein [Candidatus Woesearchaeota archaeon]